MLRPGRRDREKITASSWVGCKTKIRKDAYINECFLIVFVWGRVPVIWENVVIITRWVGVLCTNERDVFLFFVFVLVIIVNWPKKPAKQIYTYKNNRTQTKSF